MAYSPLKDFVLSKGTRIEPGDRARMTIQLTDRFQNPLVIQHINGEDIVRTNFSWEFTERKQGGFARTYVGDEVVVVDPDKATLELLIPAGVLVSPYGYSHRLSMKWENEGDTTWEIVAAGVVIVTSRQGDHRLGFGMG